MAHADEDDTCPGGFWSSHTTREMAVKRMPRGTIMIRISELETGKVLEFFASREEATDIAQQIFNLVKP